VAPRQRGFVSFLWLGIEDSTYYKENSTIHNFPNLICAFVLKKATAYVTKVQISDHLLP